MIELFNENEHRNIMFSDLTEGFMVQANQHLIVHGNEAMILDPGGHKIYPKLFSGVSSVVRKKGLKYIFFSHQDPDIIASANAWLMVSDAEAYISELWIRFVPHFGVDKYVISRIHGIPDNGMTLNLGGVDLKIIPAHFLHSVGNFQVYDPVSKILYSGDLGASLGADYDIVKDFNNHIQYMEAFHKRYIPSGEALKAWADMVKKLDINMIVPQHGAIFNTPELSKQFIEWVEGLSCGLDIMRDIYKIPN